MLKLIKKKRKWLLFGGYNPNKHSIQNYLAELGKSIDELLVFYDNLLIMGDFNSELSEVSMKTFCEGYSLINLIKDPTCFKHISNPTCIDLILTNKSSLFQHSRFVETGLSDFHQMTITVMKMSYQKLKPKIIAYRNYNNFNNEHFRSDLINTLPVNYEQDLPYGLFEGMFMKVLNKHAPQKCKYLRGNHQPFMNRLLSKAIMARSRLRNIYLKNNTVVNRGNYVKQRNFCVNLLRKVKRDYYNNINVNNITDNKKFWGTIKPGFTDKVNSNDQISLMENNEIITDSAAVANIMANFFSNVVSGGAANGQRGATAPQKLF